MSGFETYVLCVNTREASLITSDNRDIYLILVSGLVVLASGADLLSDMRHGASMSHLVQEGIILLLSLGAVLWLLTGLLRQQHEIEQLKKALVEQHGIRAEPYVVNARQQLGEVIHQQFEDWSLTPSEQEVGWLLLKGLSLKEIAVLRDTREKTVRQQASSIYRKADLSGRHAFSAWFIEDIL